MKKYQEESITAFREDLYTKQTSTLANGEIFRIDKDLASLDMEKLKDSPYSV